MNIEYRDTSYRPGAYGSGRKIRQTEARVGDIKRTGATKTEAKASLLEALAQQAQHCFVRRYLSTDEVTFALSYCDGWRYDIVKPGRTCGSILLSAESEHEAFERMKNHFDQYTGAIA